MDFNDSKALLSSGFEGFETIGNLWSDKSIIPREIGVYLVISNSSSISFLVPGVGGFFKGKNPNVDEDTLKDNWVASSKVVYIGKAGSSTGKATLRSRLGQYLRFGQGANVGHWGGRLIWQSRITRTCSFVGSQRPAKTLERLNTILYQILKYNSALCLLPT